MDPEARKRQKQKVRQRFGLLFLFLFLLLVVVAYISIRWSGEWLVKDQPVDHVRWAIILEGQSADMERTDFGVKLLLEGKVDSVIVMGRRVFRDRNNVEFYLDDMEEQGGALDASRIYLFKHDDNSSLEEAYSVIPALKQKGIDTVLLVTRGVATRRVNQIFNKLSGGSPVFLTVNLEDARFDPRTWIHTREARKIWLKEWASLLISQIELLGADIADPIAGKTYPMERAVAVSETKNSGDILVPIAALLSSDSKSSSSAVKSSSSSQAKVPDFSAATDSETKETKVAVKQATKKMDKSTVKAAEKKTAEKKVVAKTPEKKTAVKSDKKSDKKPDKKTDSKSDKKAEKKD